jgi:hypothetical protein
VSSTNQGQMLEAAVAMLNGLNALTGFGAQVGIWSRRDHQVHPVARVRVGDVPDNISRRRNHLRETYVSDLLDV